MCPAADPCRGIGRLGLRGAGRHGARMGLDRVPASRRGQSGHRPRHGDPLLLSPAARMGRLAGGRHVQPRGRGARRPGGAALPGRGPLGRGDRAAYLPAGLRLLGRRRALRAAVRAGLLSRRRFADRAGVAGRRRGPAHRADRRGALRDVLHAVEPPSGAAGRCHVARPADLAQARARLRKGSWRPFPRRLLEIGLARDARRRRTADGRPHRRALLDVLGRAVRQRGRVGQPDRLDAAAWPRRRAAPGARAARRVFRQRTDRVRPAGRRDRCGHPAPLQRQERRRGARRRRVYPRVLLRRAGALRRGRSHAAEGAAR